MERNFYCPICGALQKNVILEESNNHFICDKCHATIHITKIDEGKVKEFTVIEAEDSNG